MKDGIRNQLKGLEIEQKRLEALMSSDPAWIAYRQLATDAAGNADGSPAEQELPEDIADSLRENRLFRAWMNLVAAEDSLRELLEPDDLPQDQAQEPQNQQTALGQSMPVENVSAETGVEREAFRTKLVLKSDAATAEKVEKQEAHKNSDATPEQTLDVVEPEESAPDLLNPVDLPNNDTVLPLAALLLGRASSNAQITQQLAAIQVERATKQAASLPEAARALPGTEIETDASVPKSAEHHFEQEPDDLSWIAGVGPEERAALEGIGLTSFAEIAAITPEQLSVLRARLPVPRSASQQQWIEQAAILASGKATAFVRLQGYLFNNFFVENPPQTPWQMQPLSAPALPEQVEPVTSTDAAVESHSGIEKNKLDAVELEPGREESTGRNRAERLPLAAVLPPLVAGLGTRTDPAPAIEVANDETAIGEDLDLEHSNSAEEYDGHTSEIDQVVTHEAQPDSDEPDYHTEQGSSQIAKNEELALSERLERFERTMSEVSLPDLRRPKPFELNGNSDEQAPPPTHAPTSIDAISILPPLAPHIDNDAIEKADNAEPETSNDLGQPELSPQAADLSSFDFEYHSEPEPVGWDEANVEILRVAKPGSQIRANSKPSDANNDDQGQEEIEQVAHQTTRDPDPSPYDLARRMERLAEPPIELSETFSRFDGEIEEASVQIIRFKPSSEAAERQEQANLSRPETSQSTKVSNTTVEPSLSKRSSRRFLDALTGSRKAR